MAKERIGIMGGTFDPIHSGHIRMAQAAAKCARLDRVLMIPDRTPPHKPHISPAEDRWRMVVTACVLADPNGEKLTPSRIELDRTGITYSEDTLITLHTKYPKSDLFFIIGADTVMELHRWHNFDHVQTLCTFLVCPRTLTVSSAAYAAEYKRLTEAGVRLISIEMENIDISSTEIRTALKEHKPCQLLCPAVREYAEAVGLYQMTARIPNAESWFTKLFDQLTAKRFAHTLGVAYMARNLALHHNVDAAQAETAALLHDCVKCLPLEEMRRIYKNGSKSVDQSLIESGNLLHAAAGAVMAEQGYGVRDKAILTAIECHTTGKSDMSKLDMVVYLADKIEPGRTPYPTLDKLRLLSMVSLEKAMLASMEGTESHVKKRG